MKLAILSDIHDHVWNLKRALGACQDVDALICCGDLCSPFIIPMLAEGFAGPIHIVFGNNDGDQFRMTQNAARYDGRVKLHGEFARLAAFGRSIGVNHFPEIAEAIASGEPGFDVVCYGHDHKISIRRDRTTDTVLINPGTIMGYHPKEGDVPATFCVFDADIMEVSVYTLGGPNEPVMRSQVISP